MAVQRPSSVGIVPAQQGGLFEIVVNSYTNRSNMSKQVRTGQSVVVQREHLQCSAEAEFRRNFACTARRSFIRRWNTSYANRAM